MNGKIAVLRVSVQRVAMTDALLAEAKAKQAMYEHQRQTWLPEWRKSYNIPDYDEEKDAPPHDVIFHDLFHLGLGFTPAPKKAQTRIFFRKQTHSHAQEVCQAHLLDKKHQQVMPVHHEKAGRLSSRNRIPCSIADAVQCDKNSACEGGLAHYFLPENK